MDVETITTLLLLLLYLVFQFSGRKKRAEQLPKTQPEADSIPQPSRPSDLEEALREIRKVLEPQKKEAPPKKIEVPTQQKLQYKTRLEESRTRIQEITRSPQRKSPEFRRIGDEFREATPIGVNRKQTVSPLDVIPTSDLHVEKMVSAKGTETESGAGRVGRILRNPQGARDAFIFSQIFTPPRSSRR